MFGEKVGPGVPGMQQDDRFSLDKMNLDRGDQGNTDIYDPFYKVNVRKYSS